MNVVQFTPNIGSMGGKEHMMRRIASTLDARVYTISKDIQEDENKKLVTNSKEFKQTVESVKSVSPECPQLHEADLIIAHSALSPLILSDVDTPVMLVNHGFFKEFTVLFDDICDIIDDTHEMLIRHDIDDIRAQIRDILSMPEILVANSNYVQAQIKKWFGVDSVVIYDPIDWTFYRPTYSNGDYFLWVGRQYWLKRPEVALKAFDELNQELHIAGETGPYSDDIRTYSRSRDNVTYHGQLGKESLRKLYSGANALIHTSYDEDCPSVIREAMACGTPTIAVDIPANREVMQETGVLCDNERPVNSIRQEVQSFEQQTKESELREKAEIFSQSSFNNKIQETIRNTY
jgi:glycosyltransferase involved in cell wall biosynthesis